ncbi:hypothetical protein [Parvularcula maris]|nr:hypothetical protein [Parvularcula maris]
MLLRSSGLALAAALLLTGCDEPAEAPAPEEPAAEVAETQAAEPMAFTYADPERGGAILTTEDEYTSRVQPREAGIRAKNAAATSFQDYAVRYKADVQDFTEEERAALGAVIEKHLPLLDLLMPLLPDELVMVKTGSVVEGGLPHTRANAIIFAGGAIPEGENLEALFLHELHHVLSRANQDLHDDYFALIGFEPCTLEEPEDLKAARLTNPDAPSYRHVMPVELAGADAVTPYLYATSDYSGQGGLGDYFGLGLLPVTLQDGVCTPVAEAPEGLLPPGEVPDFLERLGGNTGYIIHPEETLADNFVYWAMEREGLPTPELPEEVGTFWTEAAARAQN